MTVALVLAALVGLSLGLLGGGGSILAVPIFVYVLGYGPKEAIAMSLAVVGVTSLLGSVGHWRSGNVNVRVALTFGAVAMVGTFLGARLAIYMSGAVQLLLFAAVMLVAAFFMLREAGGGSAEVGDEPAPPMSFPLIAGEGIAVGVLTGLVGVGGGFLIVPALVVLGRLPMKEAVGTSLLVIALKSATGFLGYLDQVSIPWAFMSAFTGTAVVGILLGTWMVRFLPQNLLKRAFALFLLVMGGFIVYQNRSAIVGGMDAQGAPITAEGTVVSPGAEADRPVSLGDSQSLNSVGE